MKMNPIPWKSRGRLKEIGDELRIPIIFKASYDKANRTSLTSYRGPGLDAGLRILAKVKETFQLPVLSDVHRMVEVERAARVLDVIQIPAFLCRQTDLIVAVAENGDSRQCQERSVHFPP